ncbi:MAG: DNA mismatch repair protein MutS, partial [Polyangiales bacterium]
LDVHTTFAEVAAIHAYTRPIMHDGDDIVLKQARHPVVETTLPTGAFVPNDIELGKRDQRFILLTGPNMSGKSTVMRQLALASIMAQSGGFVPCESAKMAIVDRVFTRVGASDNLAAGQSTFMVEMREAAQILQQATSRSLVILDEVGRGTSTYDGLAIASAITEYLHNTVGAKTIFATHYHELCELVDSLEHAQNFHVAATERNGQIIFVYEVRKGSADRSYGIAVAELAGVPLSVVSRAKTWLEKYQQGKSGAATGSSAQLAPDPPRARDPLRQALDAIDPHRLTPVEALVKLDELVALAKSESNSA